MSNLNTKRNLKMGALKVLPVESIQRHESNRNEKKKKEKKKRKFNFRLVGDEHSAFLTRMCLSDVLRKELERQLSVEDGTLLSELMKVFKPEFGDSSFPYAEGSVRFAHAIIFEEVIDYILRSELKGTFV